MRICHLMPGVRKPDVSQMRPKRSCDGSQMRRKLSCSGVLRFAGYSVLQRWYNVCFVNRVLSLVTSEKNEINVPVTCLFFMRLTDLCLATTARNYRIGPVIIRCSRCPICSTGLQPKRLESTQRGRVSTLVNVSAHMLRLNQ